MVSNNEQCVVAVVDDDPRVRESLDNLLTSAGFEVRLFGSAEDILSGKELEVSCCLITDVRMHGIDGWELQRLALKAFPNLPVIFVTAHKDNDARQRARNLGAFALFYKPFDGEELLVAVESAVQRSNV